MLGSPLKISASSERTNGSVAWCHKLICVNVWKLKCESESVKVWKWESESGPAVKGQKTACYDVITHLGSLPKMGAVVARTNCLPNTSFDNVLLWGGGGGGRGGGGRRGRGRGRGGKVNKMPEKGFSLPSCSVILTKEFILILFSAKNGLIRWPI